LSSENPLHPQLPIPDPAERCCFCHIPDDHGKNSGMGGRSTPDFALTLLDYFPYHRNTIRSYTTPQDTARYCSCWFLVQREAGMKNNNISRSLAASSLLILLLVSSCKSDTPGPYNFDFPRASRTGLAPTFQGKWEQHSTEQIDWGMQRAASVAVETLHVGVKWGQIERQIGDYDWSLTDLIVGVGGVRTSMVINVLDARFPADIAEGDFGTAEFTERFSQMLHAFLDRYQDSITHLWIWNEVNISLEEYGISPEEYGAFYQAAVGDLRSEYTDTKFGIVVTYAYEGEQIVADVIDEPGWDVFNEELSRLAN
ncbi:MAG: hypothetical protein ACLFSE_14675, partial [Spirochaetia bacterium]